MYVIALMVGSLKKLDGLVIGDDERTNATEFLDKMIKKKAPVRRPGGWEENAPLAIGACSALYSAQTRHADRAAEAVRAAIFRPVETVGRQLSGASAVAAADDGGDGDATAAAAPGQRESETGEKKHKEDEEDGGQGSDEDGCAEGGAGGGDVDAVAVPVRDSRGAPRKVVKEASGGVLNKFEIVIGFFQTYGLVLAVNFSVPWPDAWRDISVVYSWIPALVSIDIGAMFVRLSLPIPTSTTPYLKFGVLMMLPALFLTSYVQVRIALYVT